MNAIHLDHISANPLLSEVQEAMIDVIQQFPGNPSSQSMAGEKAAAMMESAREAVAALINSTAAKEIVFTSGGTESVNHAIKGAALANADKGKHIITSSIEHSAVNRSIKRLRQQGFRTTAVAVDSKGRVDPEEVARAITDDTILVSIMHSNNEVGTIQPIEEIARITSEKKVLFHTDAVDSVGVVPVDVQKLGVDLLSFASNPYYGPTGTGGLYIRRGTGVWPIIDGGVQEKNRRGGTENILGIVGMGKAAALAKAYMEERLDHLQQLKNHLINGLPRYIDEFFLNGDLDNSLPNLVSVSVKFIEGESIMLMLEDEGYRVATRSACATGSLRASHVLMAIGLDHADAQGTLVVSPGIENTIADIDGFLQSLKPITESLRAMSPLYQKSGATA